MTQITPIETLESEHRTIMKVVNALGVLAEKLSDGEPVEGETLQDVVAFMQVFADACHHGKEDELLFPALQRKGIPSAGCPLGALRAEHVKGRTLIAKLELLTEAYAKADPSATPLLVEMIGEIQKLYANHIWKENFLAFPLVEKFLSFREQLELQEQFDRVEADIGEGIHEKYVRMAEQLHERTLQTLVKSDN